MAVLTYCLTDGVTHALCPSSIVSATGARWQRKSSSCGEPGGEPQCLSSSCQDRTVQGTVSASVPSRSAPLSSFSFIVRHIWKAAVYFLTVKDKFPSNFDMLLFVLEIIILIKFDITWRSFYLYTQRLDRLLLTGEHSDKRQDVRQMLDMLCSGRQRKSSTFHECCFHNSAVLDG